MLLQVAVRDIGQLTDFGPGGDSVLLFPHARGDQTIAPAWRRGAGPDVRPQQGVAGQLLLIPGLVRTRGLAGCRNVSANITRDMNTSITSVNTLWPA